MKFETQISVLELAQMFDLPVKGDATVFINGVGSLDSAVPGDIGFFAKSLEGKQDFDSLLNTKATCVILSEADSSHCNASMIISENPSVTFAKIASYFYPRPDCVSGVHSSVVIGEDCIIADSASIGPNVVIGDRVTIGESCMIGPNVVIESDTIIGDRAWIKSNVTIHTDVIMGADCTIHSGAVIGGDGFGYANDKGRWVKVPQMGGVRIGNGVDIGSNTCIDRGTIDPTVIEDGVILDNLIQIGHNVRLGAHSAMAGCAGVAGSTKIGKYCMIGPRAAINGHLEICDGTIVTGLSAVSKSITQKGVYSSFFPAIEAKDWKRLVARFYQLENMAQKLKTLEKNKANIKSDVQNENQER